jgi:2-C-methyl-D-erythritol 4-phosphate cytidylyltransferase
MSHDDTDTAVLGAVLDEDRGSLPYLLVHGEGLVACAAWALGEAGVHAIDLDTAWEAVRESGLALVLHDSLCPMTPSDFIARCVATALADDVVVAAVGPVTDTVKVIEGDEVGRTVDRDGLLALASPVVLPAAVVAALDARPSSDLVALVARLRAEGREVRTAAAPPEARRVGSAEDVRLLEALTRPVR